MAQPLKSNGSSRRGMTLPETLIVAGVIALILAIAALGIASVRTELKQRRTSELLVMLDASLEAYHKATSQWPEALAAAAPEPRLTVGASTDPADPVLAMLASVEPSREILERVPAELRVSPEELANSTSTNPPATRPAWGTVQDAWGQRLHCLTASSPAPVDRQAVAANGGKPIFVSAGENGEFYNKDGSEAADNLRSDELAR